MKTDKLDRYRTTRMAVLTLQMDIPFWCTLTPREKTFMEAREQKAFFLRNGNKRRVFRNFVRSLCG